jgi:membrane-bound lytic murein transglycosylase D
MFKKIFAGIYLLSLVAFAPAGKAEGILDIQMPLSDTTEVNDSSEVLVSITDPKAIFKGLYINSTTNGMNGVQLNPLAVSFVESYVDKFGKKMEGLKVTGKPYFQVMDNILSQHGVPKELKYLAVIESDLKLNARSWAGAVGPWQFMPATARNMGLKVNGKVDERKDFNKSTHAASKYLNMLYEMYGDWLLVIAAYNGGPGAVNSAIKRSGSRDFWTLQKYLPKESKNHVKKFIATHYIMEGQGGIATVTKAEAANYTEAEPIKVEGAKTQTISGRYNAAVVIRHLAMDLVSFNKMNPNFDREVGANGSYDLQLPEDKMAIFLQKKSEILSESMDVLLRM